MKNCIRVHDSYHEFQKFVYVIRIFVLLHFLGIGILYAGTPSNQESISLHVESKPLYSVLEDIEKRSSYTFLYNDKDLDLNRMVTVSVRNYSISNILSLILKATATQYTILDKQIILHSEKKEAKGVMKTQQSQTVKGKVVETDGTPLIGVVVAKRGTTHATTTDLNGNFSLPDIAVGTMLEFSTVGFVKTEKKFEGQKELIVIMLEDVQALGEVEIVAFGKQKKESVVAAITTITPAELKVPSSNLTTSFAGRMAGMIAYQRSGEPGADDASFFIRGITTFGYNNSPLILIDNIELTSTDLARLNPDDIESFSIMKDATATALYGARGANGVIYVKTKEGRKGKAKLNIRVENSFSMPTKEIELADPISYMKLYNEALLTRDPSQPMFYSQEKIDKTVPGSGSLLFPSTDWKKELIKDYTTNQRVNFNISGGGDVARYYVAASFAQDNGILKTDKNSNFNSNINLQKFTLRSNINIDVTKTTELMVRLSGSFDNYSGPITSGTKLYNMVMKSSPVLFPAKYPVDEDHRYVQHTLFGNADDGKYLNPYAELVRGYKEYERSNMGAQIELKQDLKFITEGLSVRWLMNVGRTSYYDVSRKYNPFYYGISNYDPYSGDYHISVLNSNTTAYGGTEYLDYAPNQKEITSTMYMEGALNYSRDFDKHGVNGLLVLQYNNRKYPNATSLQGSLPYKNLGLSGRFTYSYDHRYFSEFNFGYNGSERFAKEKRWGFFPSVGLGWMISNEDFFEPLTDTFSKLKMRVSYGLVGNDKIGSDRFYYLSEVKMNDTDKSANFGYDISSMYKRNGVSVLRYPNPYIAWEESTKANYALEIGLWNNDLNVTIEYYNENRKNILQQRSSIPSTMGLAAKPWSNTGRSRARGTDIALDYNKMLGKKGWIQARANFTFARSEYTAYEELTWKNEPWKSRIGKPLSQNWGYIAEGLFVDDADVENSPKQFGDYMAGDIKYRDVNGDGVITEADMVPIGFPTSPEINYGFGATFGYGSWDFSFFFQGIGRESFWIDYNSMSPFFKGSDGGDYGSNKMTTFNNLAKIIADSYWSEDNRNASAVWPRLSTTSITNNNQRNTWFMRDGTFLRLKQVEIGYSVPENIIRRLKMSNCRIYLSGTNLFSISKFKDWDVEMAGNGLGYPLQRVFNLGLNLTF